MKITYYWRGKPIQDLDPKNLTDCLKHCWDAISKHKQKRIRKKLIKIVLVACKIYFKKQTKELKKIF